MSRHPSPAATMDSRDGQPAKVRRLDSLARLWGYILNSGAPQLKLRIAAAAVLTFAGKVLGVLAPLLLGAAVNSMAAGRDATTQALLAFSAAILGWTAIRFVAGAAPSLRGLVFSRVVQGAQNRAAIEAFDHAMSLSLDYHHSKRTGALARVIDRGSKATETLLDTLFFNLAPSLVELTVAAIVMAKAFDWRFSAAAIVTVLIYGAATVKLSNWRLGFRREMNDADNEAAGRVVDALLNYETVRSFGAEDRTVAGYRDALDRYGVLSVRFTNSMHAMNIVQSGILTLGLGAMALLAGSAAMQGRLGPGDITAMILIMLNLYQPLQFLGFVYRGARQAFIDMENMNELVRAHPDIVPPAQPKPLPALSARGAGQVRFEGVTYRHSARSDGLQAVSLTARAGKTTAIVGPSGAGKTTLIRLALRLIDPQQGTVTLDNVDLRDLDRVTLRRAVALVPQDVALFNDTLAMNIAFGDPRATPQDIAAAADAAELTAFIAGLPEGLETRVGERGLKLSGGERQRVGLARALLADPRVLILDEATSALDSRTEAAIQAALRKARAGRTTIVVAHRLSTIADADEIVVIKRGRIVEQGDHEALLALGGEYASLWRRQTRGAAAGALA